MFLSGTLGAAPASFKGVRVLVVEDTWQVANALKTLFESLGMEVIGPAPTEEVAGHLAAEHAVDLAIVDVNLKGQMAYGLIDRLHADGVPLIIVSGYAVLPRLSDKAIAILQKPFNGAELVVAVRQALETSG